MINAHVVIYGDRLSFRNTLYEAFDIIDLEETPDYEFIPGHRYLVFDRDAYNHIVTTRGIHLGPRGENIYDMTKLRYCLLRNGVIMKFSYLRYKRQVSWLDNEAMYNQVKSNLESISKKFRNLELRDGISKKSGRPWYMMKYDEVDGDRSSNQDQVVFLTSEDYVVKPRELAEWHLVRTTEQIDEAFNYFMPRTEYVGLDYETNGFPFDSHDFLITGFSISGGEKAYYFDVEWMKSLGGNIRYLMDKFRAYLEVHETDVYTFNVGFEMRCTYLMLGKVYDFHEGSALNVIEGNHLKRFSLKYTAMNYSNVASWDDDFDLLNKLIGDMIWGEWQGRGKHRVQVTDAYELHNYKESPQWKYITENYSDDLEEFERLITTYWSYNSPYCMIPSTILGKYCSIDSFHTRNLRVRSDELGYSETCWNAFSDNMRLGAILQNFGGIYKDKELSSKYATIGNYYVMWGSLNAVQFSTHYDIKSYGEVKFSRDNPLVRSLLNGVNFSNSKLLLSRYYDSDKYAMMLGFNFDEFQYDFDRDLANKFLKKIEQYGGVNFRARTIFSELDSIVTEHYDIKYSDTNFSFKDEGTPVVIPMDINNFSSYLKLISDNEYAVEILRSLDGSNPTEFVTYRGEEIPLVDVIAKCKSIVNLSSNKDLPNFKSKIVTEYRKLIELTRLNVPIENIYSESLEEADIDKVDLFVGGGSISPRILLYLLEPIAIKFIDERLNELSLIDQLKWSNSKNWIGILFGYSSLVDMEPTDKYDLTEIAKIYNIGQDSWTRWFSDDLLEHYPLLQKQVMGEIVANLGYELSSGELNWGAGPLPVFYLNNVKNTSVVKSFNDLSDKNFTEVNLFNYCRVAISLRMVRKWSKVTGTYIEGMFSSTVRNCNVPDKNLISTKKFGGDLERMFFRYDVCQKISKRWGSPWHTVPAKSQSKRVVKAPKGYLLAYFDVSAAEVRALAYASRDPRMMEAFDNDVDLYVYLVKMIHPDWTEKEAWAVRWLYKIIMLGSIYGMSANTMGGMANITEEEAAGYQKQLFDTFPVARDYIQSKGEYCLNSGGVVETILGDKLKLSEPEDRLMRLGINQCIQGGTSVIMQSGFYNNFRKSRDLEHQILVIGGVHDSSQTYFHVSMLFDIIDFFYTNFTKFIIDEYKMNLTFDLMVGSNYYDVCQLELVDSNQLRLKADYTTLKGIIDTIEGENLEWRIELPEEFKPNPLTNQFEVFVKMYASSYYDLDESEFTINIFRD